ncbi:MAG: SURF1 family cytochrome oxidase biogenesis protein [Arachnia sp.]
MKRLVLRWIALAVFLVLLAVLFVNLGEWQLARLDETKQQNEAVAANRDLPVVPHSEVMGAPVTDSEQWQRVRLNGSYTGEQFRAKYRNHDGPGIEVLAIFQTTSGDTVLVDRGFIPKQQGMPDTEVLPPVPTGDVEIVGFLRRDERANDTAITPNNFDVRMIDSGAIGASLDAELLPGYVTLLESTPADDSELTPITPPPDSEGNHFSYALQWFAFGAIALIGIVVLIRSDLKDRQKAIRRAERLARRKAAAGEEATEAPVPESVR